VSALIRRTPEPRRFACICTRQIGHCDFQGKACRSREIGEDAMKLWLIERPVSAIGYDEYCGFVIRAETEAAAREIAANESADEGRDVWFQCKCSDLTQEGEPGVVLDSFNAG
jgi:hypothetical protein